MKLVLETKEQPDKTVKIGSIGMVTPAIDDGYWLARVRVSKGNAVVCFPKFCTIGIGFQNETDWNTNLPFGCSAEEIYDHIRHNAGRGVRRDTCIAAIQMLREFAAKHLGRSLSEAEARQRHG